MNFWNRAQSFFTLFVVSLTAMAPHYSNAGIDLDAALAAAKSSEAGASASYLKAKAASDLASTNYERAYLEATRLSAAASEASASATSISKEALAATTASNQASTASTLAAKAYTQGVSEGRSAQAAEDKAKTALDSLVVATAKYEKEYGIKAEALRKALELAKSAEAASKAAPKDSRLATMYRTTSNAAIAAQKASDAAAATLNGAKVKEAAGVTALSKAQNLNATVLKKLPVLKKAADDAAASFAEKLKISQDLANQFKAALATKTKISTEASAAAKNLASLKSLMVAANSSTTAAQAKLAAAQANTKAIQLKIDTAGPATQLALSAPPSSGVAGSPLSFSVNALDSNGRIATGFSGSATMVTNDKTASLPDSVLFANGVAKFSITFKTSGSTTLSVTSGSLKVTSPVISISSAAASQLVLFSPPASAAAGSAVSFTVTAKDAYDNLAEGLSGALLIASSDASAMLPGNASLASGIGSFSVTFKSAGSNTITLSSGSLKVTSPPISILPGSASQLLLSGLPSSLIAGAASTVVVTAKDSYGNTASGFSGSVAISSSDSSAALPAASLLSSGVGTFSLTLKTAGSKTVTASSGSLSSTSPSITVNPGAYSVAQSVVTASGVSVISGSSVQVTLSVKDAYGNAAPTGLPALSAISFTSSLVGGTGSFGAITNTGSGVYTSAFTGIVSGAVTLGATLSGSAIAKNTAISIFPGVATQLVLTTVPSSTIAGAPLNLSVTAKDLNNNVATGFLSSISISSSDSSAILPSARALSSGVGTFVVTLKSAGSRTLTAAGSNLSKSATILVNPGAVSAANSIVSASNPSIQAGSAFKLTLSPRDAYGNRNPSGFSSSMVSFGLEKNSGSLVGSGFTSSNGLDLDLNFRAERAGVESVSAKISNITVGGSFEVSVAPGPIQSIVLGDLPSSVNSGDFFSLSVAAYDAYHNLSLDSGSISIQSSSGEGFSDHLNEGTATISLALNGSGMIILSLIHDSTGIRVDSPEIQLIPRGPAPVEQPTALVQVQNPDRNCGGLLIHLKQGYKILTPAHCVAGYKIEDLSILYAGEQRGALDAVNLHPLYNAELKSYDMALLIPKDQETYKNEGVQFSDDLSDHQTDQKTLLIGWENTAKAPAESMESSEQRFEEDSAPRSIASESKADSPKAPLQAEMSFVDSAEALRAISEKYKLDLDPSIYFVTRSEMDVPMDGGVFFKTDLKMEKGLGSGVFGVSVFSDGFTVGIDLSSPTVKDWIENDSTIAATHYSLASIQLPDERICTGIPLTVNGAHFILSALQCIAPERELDSLHPEDLIITLRSIDLTVDKEGSIIPSKTKKSVPIRVKAQTLRWFTEKDGLAAIFITEPELKSISWFSLDDSLFGQESSAIGEKGLPIATYGYFKDSMASGSGGVVKTVASSYRSQGRTYSDSGWWWLSLELENIGQSRLPSPISTVAFYQNPETRTIHPLGLNIFRDRNFDDLSETTHRETFFYMGSDGLQRWLNSPEMMEAMAAAAEAVAAAAEAVAAKDSAVDEVE